jgi:outer membrane protein OmpA-like peptidoglycan-associated protein
MSNGFCKSGHKAAALLIAGCFALSLGIGLARAGDQPSPQTIIKSLTPPKDATRTRGLSESPADKAKRLDDAAFINSIRDRKTRSLSTVELDKLSTITAEKPNIDLEINFEFDSDRISRSAKSTVEALGKALTDPSLKGNTFVLAGYADATGKADYNQDLSERRAAAVKQYLVDNYSIPAANIVTVGYGSTHLKNTKDPYAAENRRVAVVNMNDSATATK